MLYSKIENLVLRARSEKIGCAVNIRNGMVEYWEMVLSSAILLGFADGTKMAGT